MSRVVRQPAFCIYENKDADQLRGNREADQTLCFRYTDSTIPLLLKSEISSLLSSSVTVQPGLCRTWSETPKTGFLTTRLICEPIVYTCTDIRKSGVVLRPSTFTNDFSSEAMRPMSSIDVCVCVWGGETNTYVFCSSRIRTLWLVSGSRFS